MIPVRILIVSGSLILISSCRREVKVDPALEAMKEHREEMQAMSVELKNSRERLQAQQQAWDEEREALRIQREAAEKEQQRIEQEQVVTKGDIEERSGGIEQREEVLAQWEEQLGEREQEVAGQQALIDWIPEEPEGFQEPVADYDLFYDELDDYGSWYESDDYGYVYQPLIVIQDQGWRPYTRGRWVCTNYGWNWVSDEPFGWATYHYGRWCQIPKRGWCWVPGSKWAPSWCAWREGNGHVGWAPLPPESMAGKGRAWGRGSDQELCIGDDAFNFVESRHMAAPAWQHCQPRGRNAYLRARTRCCTNLHHQGDRVIAGGPGWSGVRQAVGRPWPVHELEFDPVGGLERERARHGYAHGRALRVFNPNVGAQWNSQLCPEKVAGRIEGGRGKPANIWAAKYQQARQAQGEKVQALSARMRDGLKANREAVARAQEAYRQRLVGVRAALAARPSTPRPAPAEVVEVVAPQSPQANVPPALDRLLPRGVIPLPEAGRTVEESIVARVEPQPVQVDPRSTRAREVPVATVIPPSREVPIAGRGREIRQPGSPVATIGHQASQPLRGRPSGREIETITRPTPQVGRPSVGVNQSVETVPQNKEVSPPVVSNFKRRQAQMKDQMIRQQEAVRMKQEAAKRQLQQAMENARSQQQQFRNKFRNPGRGGASNRQAPTNTPPQVQAPPQSREPVPTPAARQPAESRQRTAPSQPSRGAPRSTRRGAAWPAGKSPLKPMKK